MQLPAVMMMMSQRMRVEVAQMPCPSVSPPPPPSLPPPLLPHSISQSQSESPHEILPVPLQPLLLTLLLSLQCLSYAPSAHCSPTGTSPLLAAIVLDVVHMQHLTLSFASTARGLENMHVQNEVTLVRLALLVCLYLPRGSGPQEL